MSPPTASTPLHSSPPTIRTALHKTLSEILGLAAGFSSGRGGSMHLQWHEAGALGTNAIVGGGVPLGAGNAWAQKHAGTDDVTVCYFGDGAVNIGSVLETMNLAAAWKLPICFFIENNLYAVSTNVEEATGEPRLSGRGPGFGIASWRVDGMDPLAVHLATTAATEHMRAGNGPAVVEAQVYRFFHQNGSFPGSAFGYRSKDEEKSWRDRDPLDLMARRMIERGLITLTPLRPYASRHRTPWRRSPASSQSPIPTASPDRGGSGPSCGPTHRSPTSASAATSARSPDHVPRNRTPSPDSSRPDGSSTPSPL